MKKILIVVLLAGFLAAAGFAQDFNNPQIIEKLGLTQEQVEQLKLIYEEAQEIIRAAQLDIDIERAQLKKVLAQNNVDLRQVERRLKSIVDLEYEVRLEQIKTQVRVRKVIGNKKWAQLIGIREMRRTREAGERTREREPDPETSQKQDSKSK